MHTDVRAWSAGSRPSRSDLTHGLVSRSGGVPGESQQLRERVRRFVVPPVPISQVAVLLSSGDPQRSDRLRGNGAAVVWGSQRRSDQAGPAGEPGPRRGRSLAQAGRNAPGRAMTRLAERIEAMVRARVRPVTTEVRSTAAHSVLRSTHLTRDADLVLPAFAVFGTEATGNSRDAVNQTLRSLAPRPRRRRPSSVRTSRRAGRGQPRKGRVAQRARRP